MLDNVPISVLPTSAEFLAMPSHMDWEGNIFIFICPLTPNQDTFTIVGLTLGTHWLGMVMQEKTEPVIRYLLFCFLLLVLITNFSIIYISLFFPDISDLLSEY